MRNLILLKLNLYIIYATKEKRRKKKMKKEKNKCTLQKVRKIADKDQ